MRVDMGRAPYSIVFFHFFGGKVDSACIVDCGRIHSYEFRVTLTKMQYASQYATTSAFNKFKLVDNLMVKEGGDDKAFQTDLSAVTRVIYCNDPAKLKVIYNRSSIEHPYTKYIDLCKHITRFLGVKVADEASTDYKMLEKMCSPLSVNNAPHGPLKCTDRKGRTFLDSTVTDLCFYTSVAIACRIQSAIPVLQALFNDVNWEGYGPMIKECVSREFKHIEKLHNNTTTLKIIAQERDLKVYSERAYGFQPCHFEDCDIFVIGRDKVLHAVVAVDWW